MKPLLLLISILLSTLLPAQQIKYDEWKNLTTSGKLPKECRIQRSNNNLDLVKFKERYYLAFRTAPVHFPSGKAVLYVVSSADLESWSFEKEIKLGLDLREPRFAVYHDTLNLYFFTGSKHMTSFDPREILLTRCTGKNDWSAPASVHLDGFVPWRIRQRDDTLFLSAYYGKNLYRESHQSNLRLFSSIDAVNWQPISQEPQVNISGAEEGEFIFDSHGDLYSTVRLEGTGALVCKADKCCISDWKTVRTRYKYDSALMFDHGDDIYLISRRNNDGPMDKRETRSDEKKGRLRNLVRYWFTTKVTALWKLNKDDLSLALVTDFPSKGDCAFPAIDKLSDDTYLLMNYSSNINRPQKSWFAGQFGKTYIYWTTLRFEK